MRFQSAYVAFIAQAYNLCRFDQLLFSFGSTKIEQRPRTYSVRSDYLSGSCFSITPPVPKTSSTLSKLAQGVYRRTRQSSVGVTDNSTLTELKWEYYGKFEPRFKPPRETLASGEILKFSSYLPLGGYDTEEDAKVVHRIAAFFYGKGQDQLDLGNGDHFSIDSVLNEQDRCLSGKEKAKWVSRRARDIFEVFKKEKAARGLLIETTGHSRVHSGKHVTNAGNSSSKELGAVSSAGICKRAEGLASASEVSPFAESSQDGERRMLPHGPLHSSMVAAQVGVRGHALLQFAEPQGLCCTSSRSRT